MTKVATSGERVNQKRQLKCNSYIGFLFNYLHAEKIFIFLLIIFFFKINVFKKLFRSTIRVTNDLDPDQD